MENFTFNIILSYVKYIRFFHLDLWAANVSHNNAWFVGNWGFFLHASLYFPSSKL